MDEAWHSICQVIFHGVEGSEWENMCCTCVVLHKAVKCKTSRESKKARALWALAEAKDKGKDVYDLGSVQKIQTRSQVRLYLWATHLKSPMAM